jgi:hypothetical protein
VSDEIWHLLGRELRRARHEGGAAVLDTILAVTLDGIERDMVGVGLTPERRADVIRLIASAAAVDTSSLPALRSDEDFRTWVKAVARELRARGAGRVETEAALPPDVLATLSARPVAERVWFSEVVAQVLNAVLTQADSPGRRTAMSAIDGYLDSIPGRRILYRGRPDWLTTDAFDFLRAEAAESFDRARERFTLVEYAEVSALAEKYVEEWTEFRSWIDARCGLPLEPRIRKVTFQYNRPTDHLPWHIDKPDKVALNCLIMLERSPIRHSALQLYTHDARILDVDLDAGEVLLFKGDATPHRRTPLTDGEFVRLMSIGFMLSAQQ